MHGLFLGVLYMKKSILLVVSLLICMSDVSAVQPTPSTTVYSPCAVITGWVAVNVVICVIIPRLYEVFITSRTKKRIAEIESLVTSTGFESLEDTLPNGMKILIRREDCFNVCYIDGYKVDIRAFLEEGR